MSCVADSPQGLRRAVFGADRTGHRSRAGVAAAVVRRRPVPVLFVVLMGCVVAVAAHTVSAIGLAAVVTIAMAIRLYLTAQLVRRDRGV